MKPDATWPDQEWHEDRGSWRVCEQGPFGEYLELRQGSTEELPALRDVMADPERFEYQPFAGQSPSYTVLTGVFVAQLRFTSRPHQPETLVARIWSECLGPSIIPFDPDSRRALIEKGRQHAELRRHIEYWERARQE